MQTNNQYYKAICENMNIPVEQGVHNNNYYLKRIATYGYGKSYTGTVCNGILIKDIAEAITESTYTGHHFNNFYLKEIASALTGDDYNTEFDNYYLNIWAENIAPINPSNLIWQVPPSDMEYGDFNTTGLLTDVDNNPISGATVYLVVGSTKVDNAQTDSNGVVTFTGSPVHTGTHSFKLVFEGNPNYTSSESSTVTITISKETTLLEVTSPANNSTWYDDGNILVTGSLLDNDSPDSSPVANARIRGILQWWDSRGLQDSRSEVCETNNEGEFSMSIPAPSYDDMSASDKRGTLRIWYQGDDDYTASSQENIILNIAKPYINLESDKSTLSKADDDKAVLTATLYSSDKVDKAVSFDIVDSQGTVLSHIGDGVTGSDGKASFTYESQGVGDIIIRASATIDGILVSKTYSIQDCLKYIDSYSKTFSTSSVEWDNITDLGSSLGDVEITCKLKSTNIKGFRIDLSKTNQYENKSRVVLGANSSGLELLVEYNDSGTGDSHTYSAYTVNTDANCTIHRENDNIVLTMDSNTYTFPDVSNLRYIGFTNWETSKTLTVTDLKVKPL